VKAPMVNWCVVVYVRHGRQAGMKLAACRTRNSGGRGAYQIKPGGRKAKEMHACEGGRRGMEVGRGGREALLFLLSFFLPLPSLLVEET